MAAVNGIKFVKKDTIDSLTTTDDNVLYFAEVETYGPDGAGNWYILYPNGWCEQGGNFGVINANWVSKTATFMKEFKDTSYYAGVHTGHTSNTDEPCINVKQTTYFTCYPYNSSGNANWHACGFVKED